MDLAKSGEAVKAGPIGLAVILLLCIACYFLFKSMSKHMRNVRENFPAESVPTPTRAEVARAVTLPPTSTSAECALSEAPSSERPPATADSVPPQSGSA